MSLNRYQTWLLALGSYFLLTTVAAAQTLPFAASQDATESGVFDAEIFSQAEPNLFSTRLRQPDGYFGTAEAILWFSSAPRYNEIGVNGGSRQVYVNNSSPLVGTGANNNGPTATSTQTYQTQTNSTNNGFLRATSTPGFRFDWGYVEEERGWLFSAFSLTNNVQSIDAGNVSMVFNDPGATVYNGYNGTTDGLSPVNAASTNLSANVNPNLQTLRLPLLSGFVLDPRSFTFTSSNGTTSAITPFSTLFQYGWPLDINRNGLAGGVVPPLGTATAGNATGNPSPFVPGTVAGTVSGTPAPIDYGDAVPLPVVFSSVRYTNTTKNWSIEANRIFRRTEQDRFGGYWEAFGGARYFSFVDTFQIDAQGGILDASYWKTNSYNNVVGPQVGLRWLKENGRIQFSSEGRFTAGANFQTARQEGTVGSNLVGQPVLLPQGYYVITNPVSGAQSTIIYPISNNPGGGPSSGAYRLNQPLNLQATSFQSRKNWATFSPLVELRAKVSYQVFRSVSVSAGWTGIYVNNVARASNLTNYTLPNFGLNDNHEGYGVFINGLTLGVEVNR